ncbi:MAG: hypothetical protein E7571_00130 [Ruminococcaceae bacterium]|nr:hypothetical protein [Oscillospiraceae bacterium]
MTEYTLTPMTKVENLYSYRQSQQISMQTGYYGYLHGDFGKDGKYFNSTFEQFSGAPLREHFETERDNLLDFLEKEILRDLHAMTKYCDNHEEAAFKGAFGKDYGFRIDSGNQTFLLVMHPRNVADYAVHLYSYDKHLLDEHIKRAEKGIRFINSNYEPLFNIEDGDGIMIRYPDGDTSIRACRYIDDYHTQIGNSIYHICEFAEITEKNGATVIPYRNSLPEKCYVYVDTREAFGIVTKGKDGFELCAEAKFPDGKRNFEYADKLNEELGITKAQSEAMTMASMMGWADKLADPRTYEPKQKTDYDRGGR